MKVITQIIVLFFVPMCAFSGNTDTTTIQSVNIPVKESVESFDPVLCVDETSGIVLNILHRNLFTTETNGNFVPDLTGEVVIGYNKVFVRLKSGIYFNHTEKLELTADDVVFCLNRLRTSGRQPWVLDKITGIRAYNKYTVVFDFPMKNYDDWIRQTYLLSLPQTAIYSRKIYEEKQIFSGASRFLLLKSNQESITLVSGNDILLNYQVIPSESGRWFNFKRNKLDIYEADGIFQFMPNQLKGFKKVVKDQATVFYAAIVSEQNSILAIKEIRRALNYKIDRKNLTEKILLKSYIPADYPVPDILGMHLEPVYNYQKDYDCLSLTSGYENEMIDIFTMSDRDRQLMGRVIQNVLSDCKIKSRIKALDLATLIKFNNEKKKGIYLLKWIADYPHAENFLIPLFHSQNAGSGGNRSFYQNKILDNLLDKGVNMDNLSEIQNIIRMDAPWIFIGFSRKTYYVNEEKKIDIPAVYTGWNENAFGL